MKTPAKVPAPPQQPQPKEAGSTASKVGAVILGCTLSSGCPSPATTAQVRRPTLPPPAECPPGAQQSMKELGLLYSGSIGYVTIEDSDELSVVRPGPVTMSLVTPRGEGYWGKLPEGTLFSGERLFGENRVQGRFTQVHTPDGKSYVVCLELMSGAEWGWEKREGSGADTATIETDGRLVPVERFGVAGRYEERKKR